MTVQTIGERGAAAPVPAICVAAVRFLAVAVTVAGLAAHTARVARAEPSPGQQVHLPILNHLGDDDVCASFVEVQNLGGEPAKAILMVWGERGYCPPQCAGPLKVECSGYLRPGSTWIFTSAQVPTGAKSAMVFSATANRLSDLDPPLDGQLGFDDVVADILCETLFFGVVGDCDDYRRFKKAWREGGTFGGLPMDQVRGSPMAVEVLRRCPGDVTPGVDVTASYSGVSEGMVGIWDPMFGGFSYYVPLMYAGFAGFDSWAYIQNTGLECTSVSLWMQAQDQCGKARICAAAFLAPGETLQAQASKCVGPAWMGSAWVRSSEPLAIVVDHIGHDVLMSYRGMPAQLQYTFQGEPFFAAGSQVAYGPLLYSEFQGWDAGIQVQNLSSHVSAKVKVYFMDRSGGIVTTIVDWICPRGSQTFFLPVVANLPGNWVGHARVESQEWWVPNGTIVPPPDIQAVAHLIKYSDVVRTTALQAIAYNLFVEQQAYDWQLGPPPEVPCPGAGCVGLIGIPSFLKDRGGTGITTEIAIANVVPKPGFTDFAVYVYDQNGLVDYVCEKLSERQVEYINLDVWGFLSPGFKGSAVISAVFWEHEMFDGWGRFLRNLVGLAAITVERSGTVLGEEVPGDESAGSEGFPVLDTAFEFAGPHAPSCPGVPIQPPVAP